MSIKKPERLGLCGNIKLVGNLNRIRELRLNGVSNEGVVKIFEEHGIPIALELPSNFVQSVKTLHRKTLPKSAVERYVNQVLPSLPADHNHRLENERTLEDILEGMVDARITPETLVDAAEKALERRFQKTGVEME